AAWLHRHRFTVDPGGIVVEFFSFDIDVGQYPVQPPWQPPCVPTEQCQHRRHDGHPHDERVDRDSEGQCETDRLDEVAVGEDEPCEHAGHDQCCSDHHAGTVAESRDHGLAWRPAVDVLFPHAADQENLVVHCQTEQHTDQQDRQHTHDRTGVLDTEDAAEPAPLEHGHH